MVKKFLKDSTVPGQWYVSQAWESGMIDRAGAQLSRHEHYGVLNQFIMAGPFVERSEAEIWNTKHADGHAAVWQG
jgi:hypothetical protein